MKSTAVAISTVMASPAIVRPTAAQIAQFSGVPFQQRYPVALDATKKFLVDQNAVPCDTLGDNAGSLIVKLQTADIELYLSTRAAQGFNTVIITVAVGGTNDAFGNQPFTGSSYFTNFNAPYWNNVVNVVKRALAYGITVLVNPWFVGLDATQGEYSNFYNLPTATIQAYGTFLGNLLKPYPNVIVVFGGDADPNNAASWAAINTCAVSYRAAAPNHLITIEASRLFDTSSGGGPVPNGGYSTVDGCLIAFGNIPAYVSLNWVYQSGPTVGSGSQRNYGLGLPSIGGEFWYFNEHATTRQDVRSYSYISPLAGCTIGPQYGINPVYLFTTGWQAALTDPSASDQMLAKNLFNSRAWQRLVPDSSDTTMTVGRASGSWCGKTSDSVTAMAYLPSVQMITMNMAAIIDAGSQAKCWWRDPTNGATINIGTFSTTGTRNFTPPGNNAAGDGDWNFAMDSNAAGLGPPGT